MTSSKKSKKARKVVLKSLYPHSVITYIAHLILPAEDVGLMTPGARAVKRDNPKRVGRTERKPFNMTMGKDGRYRGIYCRKNQVYTIIERSAGIGIYDAIHRLGSFKSVISDNSKIYPRGFKPAK